MSGREINGRTGALSGFTSPGEEFPGDGSGRGGSPPGEEFPVRWQALGQRVGETRRCPNRALVRGRKTKGGGRQAGRQSDVYSWTHLRLRLRLRLLSFVCVVGPCLAGGLVGPPALPLAAWVLPVCVRCLRASQGLRVFVRPWEAWSAHGRFVIPWEAWKKKHAGAKEEARQGGAVRVARRGTLCARGHRSRSGVRDGRPRG
jgi:hypothetical protein